MAKTLLQKLAEAKKIKPKKKNAKQKKEKKDS